MSRACFGASLGSVYIRPHIIARARSQSKRAASRLFTAQKLKRGVHYLARRLFVFMRDQHAQKPHIRWIEPLAKLRLVAQKIVVVFDIIPKKAALARLYDDPALPRATRAASHLHRKR